MDNENMDTNPDRPTKPFAEPSGSPAAHRYYLSRAVIIDSWKTRDDRAIVTQEDAVRMLNEHQYRLDAEARATRSENDKMRDGQ